jgi:lactate dehydrogenase-like 2-hydroxyacid dehydrogenase
MRVLSYTPRPIPDEESRAIGVEQLSTLDQVLEAADFVSLHCPAIAETHHLMNAVRFRRMQPSAYLINTARGDVVDEQALVEALDDGSIAGAALDVYQREPGVPDGLLRRENVVLLPHLGSATESTRIAMGMKAVENLRAYFETGRVLDPVMWGLT